MPTALELAAPLLRRQHALATAPQLVDLGVHPQSIARLVDRGVWDRIDASLYGPAGVPMSWRRTLMAAVLVGPPGTVVSHRAGASLTGVGGLSEPTPEVSIPQGTTLRRPNVIAHESCDLDLADVRAVDGIPVTGIVRLAVDLGAVVTFERYKHTVREMRHGHGVSNDDLMRAYLRHSRRGRNGCGALRDWLDRYYAVEGNSESGLELTVLDAIIDADLPAPVRQLWVDTPAGRYRLDLAYPSAMLAIEVDGRQHRDGDIARDDRLRTAALEAAGWTVMRIRSWAFASDLFAAVRTIRSAVSGSHLV